MNIERKNQLLKFQERLGINFENLYILNTALTHSSYAHQYNLKYNDHNERLEFLGDSVLSVIVSEYLYRKYKNKQEGKLSRIRAGVVCEGSLAEVARKLEINKYILIGKGEELSGGRDKDSLLADACEAIIAAIYLDKGLEAARNFVLKYLTDKIDVIVKDHNYNDYKSKLQEYVQRNLLSTIEYKVVSESGPAHDRTFHIDVYLDNKCFGKGTGKSKKEAEQRAAREALNKLGVEEGE
ncbi:ribonuclease III [Fonticella tunisiensis]|uniref:Ribonuclease 3 n=1 Tax=Fonticella tunisiensis TaxID=1096341 RepID=A0A4R7KS18_9CLOT|nr:ribonuclease III [Fonticella tunisiensis]TDT61607.1 ribonuclease-3 [Fonticella tunisiensis]